MSDKTNPELENLVQQDSDTGNIAANFHLDKDLKRSLRLVGNGVTDDEIDDVLLHLDNQIAKYRKFAYVTEGKYIEPARDTVIRTAATEKDISRLPFNFSLGYVVYPEIEAKEPTVNLYRGIYSAPLTPTQQPALVRRGVFTEGFIEDIRTGQKNLAQILEVVEGNDKYLANYWRELFSQNNIDDLSQSVANPEVLKHFIELHKNIRFGEAFWVSATSSSEIAINNFSTVNPQMGLQSGEISGVFSLKIPKEQALDVIGFSDRSSIEQFEYLIWGSVKPEWQRVFVPRGVQSKDVVINTLKSIEIK